MNTGLYIFSCVVGEFLFVRCLKVMEKKCTLDIVFIKDEGYKRLILMNPHSL